MSVGTVRASVVRRWSPGAPEGAPAGAWVLLSAAALLGLRSPLRRHLPVWTRWTDGRAVLVITPAGGAS